MVARAGGLSSIGPMLEERAVMKAETSDALYSPAPYIISMFVVDLVNMLYAVIVYHVIYLITKAINAWPLQMLAVVGNTLFFVAFFSISGLDTNFRGPAFGWTLLGALTLDSIVGFVAAVSGSMETALTLAGN